MLTKFKPNNSIEELGKHPLNNVMSLFKPHSFDERLKLNLFINLKDQNVISYRNNQPNQSIIIFIVVDIYMYVYYY